MFFCFFTVYIYFLRVWSSILNGVIVAVRIYSFIFKYLFFFLFFFASKLRYLSCFFDIATISRVVFENALTEEKARLPRRIKMAVGSFLSAVGMLIYFRFAKPRPT